MSYVDICCECCTKRFSKSIKRVNESLKNGWKQFCSVECMAQSRVTAITTQCTKCQKVITKELSQVNRSKTGNVFCTRSCATAYHNSVYRSGINHANYRDGSGSYRVRALRELDNECIGCGERRSFLLIVHHKDGDRTNCVIENLEVVCNNCHVIRHLVWKDCEWIVNWNVLTPIDVVVQLSMAVVI
jgi:hypothetical protein